MPALQRMTVQLRQNLGGRRRTSLEGGNRGIRSGESGSAKGYGDLSGCSAVCHDKQAVLPDHDIAQADRLKADVPGFSLLRKARNMDFTPPSQAFPYRL